MGFGIFFSFFRNSYINVKEQQYSIIIPNLIAPLTLIIKPLNFTYLTPTKNYATLHNMIERENQCVHIKIKSLAIQSKLSRDRIFLYGRMISFLCMFIVNIDIPQFKYLAQYIYIYDQIFKLTIIYQEKVGQFTLHYILMFELY